MGAFNEAWSVAKEEAKCKYCNAPMKRYENVKTGEVKHQCSSQCYRSHREYQRNLYPTRNHLPHGMKGGYH